MSFDLFAMQQQILDRLAPIADGFAIRDTFAHVDLTDDGAAVVEAQTMFIAFDPEGQAGQSAQHNVGWSFDLYVHTTRATAAQKAAAFQLFSDALAKIAGWQVTPYQIPTIAPGQPSGTDRGVLRISFGFTLPVYVTGS